MNIVDHWVVYDTAQYPAQGWVNRNRILRLEGGWQFLTVSLDRSSFVDSYRTKIKDVRVSGDVDWREDMKRRLGHYKKRAPYYSFVIDLIERSLSDEEEYIAAIDTTGLSAVADILGINFYFLRSSSLGEVFSETAPAEEKVLDICEAIGAKEYWNLPGGKNLYDEKRFEKAGIRLRFSEAPPLRYACNGYEYIPNLSILDVLMWNKANVVKEYLDAHKP
jgi:hypothetical protein